MEQCQFGLPPLQRQYYGKKSKSGKKSFGFQLSNQTKVTIGLGLSLGGYLIAMDRWEASQEQEKFAKEMRSDGLPYLNEKPPEHNVARSVSAFSGKIKSN